MNQKWSVLGASLVGAGLMFLLDPDSGARRRKVIGDKMGKAARRSREFSFKAARDIGHRAYGMAHEIQNRRLHREGADLGVDDRVLCDRVRSKMGHVIAHPGAVEVAAEDGTVTLNGTLLGDEVGRLLSAVASVPGVRHVDNQLRVMPAADGVPSLQIGQRVNRVRQAIGRIDTPAGRVLAGTVGAVIAAYGLNRLRHGHPNGEAMPLGRPIAAEIAPS